MLEFRVWNGKQMVYKSDYVISMNGNLFRCSSYEPYNAEKDAVYMLYSGIKDKNGIKIFEGDIVRSPVLNPSVVEFREGSFSFGLDNPFLEHFSVYQDDDVEVIGNIYENQI